MHQWSMAYGTNIIERGAIFHWKFKLNDDTTMYIGICSYEEATTHKIGPLNGIYSVSTWTGDISGKDSLIRNLTEYNRIQRFEMSLDLKTNIDDNGIDKNKKGGSLWFKANDNEMKKVSDNVDVDNKWCLAVCLYHPEDIIQIVQ